MLPYGQTLINHIGWHNALLTLALTILLIVPLSAALVEKRRHEPAGLYKQSIPEALREACSHNGYWLLCIAYTVCGFQLMFISVHFPAYMIDQHMTPETGMMALALIGMLALIALPPVLVTPSGGVQLVATGALTLLCMRARRGHLLREPAALTSDESYWVLRLIA